MYDPRTGSLHKERSALAGTRGLLRSQILRQPVKFPIQMIESCLQNSAMSRMTSRLEFMHYADAGQAEALPLSLQFGIRLMGSIQARLLARILIGFDLCFNGFAFPSTSHQYSFLNTVRKVTS
jgi:hypothetical protein